MADEEQITLSTHAVYSPHSDGGAGDRLRAALLLLNEDYNCRHFRTTRVDGGIWFEGWHEMPKNEGFFSDAHARKISVRSDMRELV